MASDLTINDFAGSTPRLAPHLTAPGQASYALDCKLEDGTLGSWREPLLYGALPAGTASMFEISCGLASAPPGLCLSVAYGSPLCRKYYASVDGAADSSASTHPRWYSADIDNGVISGMTEVHFLGVPCPTDAPLAAPFSGSPPLNRDAEGRAYAYQYENDSGERSALSPASDIIHVDDGASVSVFGFTWPAEPEWDVHKVLIYRSVSGNASGREPGNAADSTWMLVGEMQFGGGVFVDDKFNEELFEAAEDDVVVPPPYNLKGMVWVESMNVLAGFVGNRVYFSANNEYHNWPHYLDLDDNVRGIVESNGTLYVATDGRPYVISAAADCKAASCRKVVRLPGNYPMLSSVRGIAKTRFGAVYPSHDGLIMLSGESAPSVLTWALYTPSEWQAMGPNMCRPVEHGGKLFVFMSHGAFVMSTPASPEQGWKNDYHTDLSDRGVVEVFSHRNGKLYLHKDNSLYIWDQGQTLRPHVWRSKEAVAPVGTAFGAANINFDGAAENVKILADGREVINRAVPMSREFRLPMWASGLRWTVELSGTATVRLVTISSAMLELGS